MMAELKFETPETRLLHWYYGWMVETISFLVRYRVQWYDELWQVGGNQLTAEVPQLKCIGTAY